VGGDNSFGHPNDEVIGRLMRQIGGENIYRTDRHGDVEFVPDGVELWVETQR
jgi:beta-lactamase superfamily II metal-dependent hydrolase